MVLRNHGLLIAGTSIAVAFVATYRMERACAMQLAFQQPGAAFHPIDDEVVNAAYARTDRSAGGGHSVALEWPALPRKLDSIEPSYKGSRGNDFVTDTHGYSWEFRRRFLNPAATRGRGRVPGASISESLCKSVVKTLPFARLSPTIGDPKSSSRSGRLPSRGA
jgi:hypothetical protein